MPDRLRARPRAGAVGDAVSKVTFPITGFWMDGAFTKRSVQLT
jgi:hypothetical protein